MKVYEITDMDVEQVNQVAVMIRTNIKSHYTIAQWAKKVKMPEKRLKRAFKEIHGRGLYTYLRELRIEKAKEMLQADKPLKQIILVIGYKNEGNFSKAFRKVAGETPSAWRAKNANDH